jgi:hypothetical protein
MQGMGCKQRAGKTYQRRESKTEARIHIKDPKKRRTGTKRKEQAGLRRQQCTNLNVGALLLASKAEICQLEGAFLVYKEILRLPPYTS